MLGYDLLICLKHDADSELHAAGILHTKKSQANSKHIRNFTDKLRDMACVVNNTFLLNKLAFTDIRANEFYHANCLKRLENEYISESKFVDENINQA